ncbi:hypothetical protein [Paenibacillus odorifer]|uniref:hypothetical protein n=1 Tax=Paenibacillus odorifer TaxID=189426 RepID=UPI00096FF814|nr:hypothetical protein [Paenibacillus odorifer]OMD50243.1 hypothetical protein BSK55_28585 [Paenibacillus odorifer]
MISRTRHIQLSPESGTEVEDNYNLYVIVTFPDRSRWASDFYTFKNIEAIRQDYIQSGACLNGAYWSAPNYLTVVDHIDRKRIEEIVDLYISEGTFEYAFEYIGQVTERDLEIIDYPEGFFNPLEKLEHRYVMRQFAAIEFMLENAAPETIAVIKKIIAEKQ